MDPAEERREMKRQKEYYNMVGYVCDSEYRILTRCPCGSTIIDEVRGKEDYDTLPGKRFFTCKNYEEEIERLTKRVEEAEQSSWWRISINRLRHWRNRFKSSLSRLLTWRKCASNENQRFSSQSSEDPKPVERRKWTPKENLVLISAWLNTSKDPIVSNEQKAGAFWKRIEEYFNSSPQLSGFATREANQCKQRWGRVNEQVCKFVGRYEAALKEQASGQNENDVMKAAHDIFLNDYQVKFSLEHAWRKLRFDQKWRSNSVSRDGGKEKRKEAAEVVPDLEEVRPPGVKACKATKRKKHRNEAAFDQIQSMLVVKQNISKQKLLDRLLAKNENDLSDTEVSLKNKLISEML
uniref:Myb-like domain-containing protein n=1 Tax=Brassica oleracea var. oleracea TaxID=109376 RepID=A0A0D3C2C6_BRAOL